MNSNKKIEWTALEYEEKERGNNWFWALSIIIVASSVTSFIYSNYFFSIFLILSGILLITFAIKKPDLVFYELNERGLKIRNRLYPYQNIKAFWVEKNKENSVLFIRSERMFMPIISMPIKQNIAEGIRNFMLSVDVKEEEMEEHISEKIMDSLGF